jgi:predicted nuclease of predicted toxin-antitoxin system
VRFLADESCDFAVVRALRVEGHEVLAVSEVTPGAEDSKVLQLALTESRILLTEDKDFGQLVYAHRQKTAGVIFLRYSAPARQEIAEEVVNLVKKRTGNLVGTFTVVQPGRIRIAQVPGA